ncbi:MAG: hypothetical protein AAFN13_07790 [Bacteroidota bacterium]
MPRLLLLATLLLIVLGALPACGLFGSEDEVRVVDYSGPPITAADAQLFGADWSWTARLDTDPEGRPRIALNLRRIGEQDGTGEEYELRLVDFGESLPRFDAGRYEQRTATSGGGFTETRRGLRNGSVAIQDFDVNGVVSGQASGDLTFTFYYDFGE